MLEPTMDGMQYVLVACDGSSHFIFHEPALDTAAMLAAQSIHHLSRHLAFLKHFDGALAVNLTIIRLLVCRI